ncbi:hypothetical protein [Amycolatopsis albispora]|uniref:Uncharacterized protein n=1 Tax=Amycolatopsis albispora TaxID=1804986 RepID=A0A344KZF1_9PSEU|nr:hypothetical protein [Amycolatopsis albispora]AXB41175.1 hypothetical protein A4R43_00480 [Amycolatopsis albispora]
MSARLSPFRAPRLYVRLAAALAIGYAAWLLLVPITVDYTAGERGVTVERTLYSWWTNHHTIIGMGPELDSDEVVAMVLFDCGNSFGPGEHPAHSAEDGPAACAEVEGPRRVIGIGLAVLGVAAFGLAVKVPAERLTRSDREEERRLRE